MPKKNRSRKPRPQKPFHKLAKVGLRAILPPEQVHRGEHDYVRAREAERVRREIERGQA